MIISEPLARTQQTVGGVPWFEIMLWLFYENGLLPVCFLFYVELKKFVHVHTEKSRFFFSTCGRFVWCRRKFDPLLELLLVHLKISRKVESRKVLLLALPFHKTSWLGPWLFTNRVCKQRLLTRLVLGRE